MNKLFFINRKDVIEVLGGKFNRLDADYKRAALLGFITCLVAYGFQLTHVVMSPDMYNEIVTESTYPINFSGRWFMAFIRNIILSDHRIVPTFNLLISIFLFFSSSLVIVKYWRIKRPLYVYISTCLITTNSYMCHILRWENAHIEASITTFFAVLALYLSGLGKKMFIPAFILMTCAHGGYQTGVAFSCVAMFAGFSLWLFHDGDFSNIMSYLKTKLLPAMLVFAGSFFLHKLILKFLMKLMDLQEGMRLEDSHLPLSVSELLSNINMALVSIPAIFSHQVLYFTYQINFIYKIFFFLSTISLIVFFLKKLSLSRFFLILIFIFSSFLSLITIYLPTIVVGYGWISNRILFPVAVFHSFIAIFILSSPSLWIRNISIISCLYLIFTFCWHNNQYAYRSFVQDRADFELTSRIISRIENLPEYDEYAGKSLKLALIGTKDIALPGYRFTATPNIKTRSEGAFSQVWSADGIFRYFHFPHTSTNGYGLGDQEISLKIAEAIIFHMKEWPSHKSVAIVDGMALVMLDKNTIPIKAKSIVFDNANQKNEFNVFLDGTNLGNNSQMSQLSPEGNFKVSGNDPSMFFYFPESKNDKVYMMRVDIKVPDRTMVQLFFKPSSNHNFTENDSLRCLVNTGQNKCYFNLYGSQLKGGLRLDPGTVAGQYRLESIVIREVLTKP